MISLTDHGREVLRSDPIFGLASLLQELPGDRFEVLGQTLAEITARMANNGDHDRQGG